MDVCRCGESGARTRSGNKYRQSAVGSRLGQLADHRPLLERAGFTIETYEEPADWRRQQRALAEGLVATEPEMSREMDPKNAGALATMARGILADMAARRYIHVVAQKR